MICVFDASFAAALLLPDEKTETVEKLYTAIISPFNFTKVRLTQPKLFSPAHFFSSENHKMSCVR
jgi:hypothetical protein